LNGFLQRGFDPGDDGGEILEHFLVAEAEDLVAPGIQVGGSCFVALALLGMVVISTIDLDDQLASSAIRSSTNCPTGCSRRKRYPPI